MFTTSGRPSNQSCILCCGLLIWQIHCSPAPVTCAASFPRIFRNCAKPIKNLQSICLFNQQPFSSCFTIQFLSGLVAQFPIGLVTQFPTEWVCQCHCQLLSPRSVSRATKGWRRKRLRASLHPLLWSHFHQDDKPPACLVTQSLLPVSLSLTSVSQARDQQKEKGWRGHFHPHALKVKKRAGRMFPSRFPAPERIWIHEQQHRRFAII